LVFFFFFFGALQNPPNLFFGGVGGPKYGPPNLFLWVFGFFFLGGGGGGGGGLGGVGWTGGQDVVWARGTTVEMVLDRDLEFTAAELDFSQAGAARRAIEGDGTVGGDGRNGSVLPGRRGGLGPRNP